MYENEAKIIVGALEAKVSGRAVAKAGPGPSATVRYYVEGSTTVLSAMLSGGTIFVQATTEPAGAILWGVREHPISVEGASRAASEMIEWLRVRSPASMQTRA